MKQVNNNNYFFYSNNNINGNVNGYYQSSYLMNQPIGDTLCLSTNQNNQWMNYNQYFMFQMQLLVLRMLIMCRIMDMVDDGRINGSFLNHLGISRSSGGSYHLSRGSNKCNSSYGNHPVNGVNSAPAGQYGGTKLTEEQVNNARIIAEVGKQKGASKRDIAIAIATAMQESGLRNLNYGDRDSVGLFQQRPSCGWGSVAQCTNPEYAAGKFFDGLLAVNNRHNMRLTDAAQKVQRSGFPEAYQKWENMAMSLTDSIVS